MPQPTGSGFKYLGQKYSQGASSLSLVTFCASAKDIRKWGGVPTKAATYHGGFQRALSTRYKKIIKYFNDGQASPTSIVVAFRVGTMQLQNLAYPTSWPPQDSLSRAPEHTLITFDSRTDLESASIEVLCAEVSALLKRRLDASVESNTESEPENRNGNGSGSEGGSQEEVETSIEEDSSSSSETSTGTDAMDDTEEGEELDVGHSKLRGFYDFISDQAKVTAWIAEDPRNTNVPPPEGEVSPTREDELRSVLTSLLRPAMIVDGQHRVWGAYHSDRASEITFTVNAIQDADWVEQVFQFVVLNKLAKPISPGFLTSILNTSLTNLEVGEIETRLHNIGIRNTDRIVMKY